MPQRLRVAARELCAATPTFGRLQRLHIVALVGGITGRSCFSWPSCPPRFLFDFCLEAAAGRGVLCARRQRGVLRRLALRLSFQFLDPRLQLANLRQQCPNNCLGFWRLANNDFFRNCRFHAHCCAMQAAVESRSICQKIHPGRERLRGINASSVVEMMNCIGLLSFTLRVNRFAVSSSPFRPQEKALFHPQRQRTVTDSGPNQ